MADDVLTASLYDNAWLESTSTSNAVLYMRNATAVVNSTISDAVNLGTLTTDSTQLDAYGAINRLNPEHFYKFTLDGENLKLSYTNVTSTVSTRVQILNSSGTVIADSSTTATTALHDAYESAISSEGLDADAGDYYVKVSFASTSPRSVPQSYVVSLYSGTKFTSSYQTTAVSQTSESQNVAVDNTGVFSTSDALEYGVDNVHLANETAMSGLTIGWLYENKSALNVKGQLTQICDEQYYSFTLQKGESIKMSFDNETDTSEIRFQLLDMSGTIILADSEGTETQQEAYAALVSADGYSANRGQFIVKISYKAGEDKNKEQIYDFTLYSGTSYSAIYRTMATAETTDTAILSGHLTPEYNPITSLVAYMAAYANGEESSVIDTLKNLAAASTTV